jgi:hypothetical protein
METPAAVEMPLMMIVAIGISMGSGGTCTHYSICATHCATNSDAFPSGYAQEPCRADEALSELVARWHRLTLNARETTFDVARGAGQHR